MNCVRDCDLLYKLDFESNNNRKRVEKQRSRNRTKTKPTKMGTG